MRELFKYFAEECPNSQIKLYSEGLENIFKHYMKKEIGEEEFKHNIANLIQRGGANTLEVFKKFTQSQS